MLVALPAGLQAEAVNPASRGALHRVPTRLRRSLAWDRGREMAAHAQLTADTGCPVYFCDPHSPWQRGSNENTNGLLRQYFPKGRFDFTTIDQTHLDHVADQLNARPRRTLNWATPGEKMTALLGVATRP